MSALKIKVSCDDDTRIWRYSSLNDFEGLNEFVEETWKLSQFIVQYEDEEGDLITIANLSDLHDAVKFAMEEKKKSLKIFVLSRNAKNEQVETEQAEQEQGDDQKEAEQAEQFGSVQEMVLDFLQNPQISALLPELFGVVIGHLIERNAVLSVDEIIEMMESDADNDKFNAVTKHALYGEYSDSVIPYVANRIFGQQALYKHFKIETIRNWIQQLMEMLRHTLINNKCLSLKDLVIDIEYPAMTDTGKVIHFGVECDLCGEYPIIGDRYKCSICADWDCCAQCEPKHDHPLIKFKKSSKNHKNASFEGLSEVVEGLSGVAPVAEPEMESPPKDIVCDCLCGAKMDLVLAKEAYPRCKFVFCDECNKEFLNETVFHCPRGYDAKHHSNGYDLCFECAQIKAEQDQLKEQDSKVDEEVLPEQSPEIMVLEADDDDDDDDDHQDDQVEAPGIMEVFAFQNQLEQLMEIMNITDDKDDRIKILLVENNGDVERVLPMLFDSFLP